MMSVEYIKLEVFLKYITKSKFYMIYDSSKIYNVRCVGSTAVHGKILLVTNIAKNL